MVLVIKIKDVKSLPDSALQIKLNDLNLELSIEKRKTASTGVASKVVKTREIRRTIARIKTVLGQRGVKI